MVRKESELSEEDIEKQIEQLHRKKEQARLNKIKKELSQLRCKNCNALLIGKSGMFDAVHMGELSLDEIVETVNMNFRVECKECERLNMISITPKGNSVVLGAFAWDELPVKDLTMEQVNRGLQMELERMGAYKGQLARPLQLLLRKINER
jgi:hypothetical protein